MKPIPYILAAALCLSSSAVSANPVTYICKTANGIVFTNQKTGAECTVSHVDGSATVSSEEADSIGGLVIQELGHLPVRGEKVVIGGLQFTVARADNRRLHTLMATKVK